MFILFTSFQQAGVCTESSSIDLYTQRKPYDGKGLNEPSDAFAPQGEVVLYAQVTYNLGPVKDKLVKFAVYGPPNPLQNITFSFTALTNASGIATVGFTIPWPAENPETKVFGVWNACASVELAEGVVEDTLTFKVGYIVEIVSLMTIDKDLQPKTKFVKGTYINAKVVFRNIAMINKTATISVTAFDSTSQPIGNVVLDDLEIEPGETSFFILSSLQIAEWATLGEAVLNASAFTASPAEGGVPWCPKVSTSFLITILIGDLNEDGVVDIRDLSRVARAFGSYPGHPRWDPTADLNQDNIVNIKDLAITARNFGKTDY